MCLKFEKYQTQNYNFKNIKRHSKEIDDDLNDEDSNTESLNDTKFSYRTAINKRSPITSKYHKDIFNRTLESPKAINESVTFNNINNKHYNNRNIELNKHFHSLNLGAAEPPRPMSCQSFQSTSANPFITMSRSQSRNSLFNFQPTEGTIHNSFSKSYDCSPGPTFKHPNFSNNLNNLLSTQHHATFNKTIHNDDQEHQMSNHNTENLLFNGTLHHSETFVSPQNKSLEEFWPRDTSSVLSHSFNRSPPVSLRELDYLQKNHGCFLNSFKPVSPSVSIPYSNRSLLSPAKFTNSNSFDKESDSCNFPFQTGSITNSSIWPKINGSNIGQKFIVNSFTNTQNHANESINVKYKNAPISRSSSSSSGFASNSDFAKAQSLPNSRDHSPERNSVLSEPAVNNMADYLL
ncbi:hypothetical protein GWI33_001731 [Rhynchophorus ferrugineus]|uniref:Uncharacterized protein n=1 Tax=Rhynchophorus ferrugineus TaxID=354439 RepID=A0A834IW21_RHYFE|nr:hypothetical protein GWI33_001731 [Rhynchophorus ferrugineus]